MKIIKLGLVFFSANILLLFLMVSTVSAQGSVIEFQEFQSIPTNGPRDWEFFTIGKEHYLAVANSRETGIGYNTDSKIYRWDGSAFTEFQLLPTLSGLDWEYFMIGNDHYLAVANFRIDSAHNINSKIYKWDGTKFAEFQTIATNGATDWEFFSIEDDYYLAVANNFMK
jgi:hypothetical protein